MGLRLAGRKENGWFNRQTVAAMFGVTVVHFDQTIRPLIPKDAIRKEKQSRMFYARAVIDAWAARRGPGPAVPRDEDEALVFGGSDSPALERLRDEKAKIAKLDREEREGQLMPLDAVQQVLTAVAARLQNLGETLQRDFGPEASRVLNEAIEDARRDFRGWLGSE